MYEKNNDRSELITGLIVAVIAILLVVVAVSYLLGFINKEDTFDVVTANEEIETDEDEVSKYEKQLRWQHIRICEYDTEQLALDLVYIDDEKDHHFVYELISKDEESTKSQNSPSSYYHYSEDDFDKLVKTLDESSYKRGLAMEIVKEFIGYEEGQLPVPTEATNSDVRKLLSEDYQAKPEKPNKVPEWGNPDKPRDTPSISYSKDPE